MSEQANTHLEFGSRKEDLTAFSDAIDAIREHNEQFSLGKIIANTIIEQVDEGERTQTLVNAGLPQDEAEATVAWVGTENLPMSEEEEMARSVVGVVNAPILGSIGLALSPLRKTATMFGPRGEQSVGEVRLQLADGGKFSGFLLAIRPENVSDDFRKDVAHVIDNLVYETTDAISSSENTQTVFETLAYGMGIVGGLKRIGLGDLAITQELSVLTQRAKQGDVKEYVLADRVGLFREPGEQSCSPSQWQRDATEKFLLDRWEEVISILKMAKNNPKASKLFIELLASATACLNYAKTDWSRLKPKKYGTDSYGMGFDRVFNRIETELSEVASLDK